jgi:hypothetical protein
MRFLPLLLLAATLPALAADFNDIVLAQIRSMPDGGGYATNRQAARALFDSVTIEHGRPSFSPGSPSYCSGATYLVLLKTLDALDAPADWPTLAPKPSADGTGIWGRWNSNGPGAAVLFHSLGLGRSFTSWEEARPGDFLKIFWTDAVGKKERGHLVVYLGMEKDADGMPRVRFWSSNKPHGYGGKSVPKSSIARAIFSRLENPSAIARATSLPRKDPWLASLLAVESSYEEALRKSGVE